MPRDSAGEEAGVKPLAIELFAGLHGFGEAASDVGYRVIGFDLYNMPKDLGFPEPRGDIQLVLQDVLTLSGAQFKDATFIWASPPCQFFSYTAMPWSKSKALAAAVRADPAELEKRLSLFNACFRIQREASEAAGHYIPMVVENVVGAQKWVGPARWHFGSYYLYGDIPALMPITRRIVKVDGFNFHQHEKTGKGGSFQSATVKVSSDSGRRTAPGNGVRFTSRDCGIENKQSVWFNDDKRNKKCSGDWFASGEDCSLMRSMSSRSHARKAASAAIAKIPYELASHIAKVYLP